MGVHKLVVIDDHPLFRGALKQSLSGAGLAAEILEAGTLEAAGHLLAADPTIDLVLLDLAMPGAQGLSGLLYLRAQHPEIPVVIVSASEDARTIRRAIELGASGYVPKSQPVDTIRAAVRAVLAGEVWTPPDISLAQDDAETSDLIKRLAALTPQQVKVLTMLGEGLLNKQIAFKLGVSEATIKAHVSAILQKLGVDSRTQAVIAINKIDTGVLPRLNVQP
jgi:DNA-binding NarL/FixJ family response regulator